jgi:hypothetical protein
MYYYRIKATERFTNLLFGNVVITKEWTESEEPIYDPRLEIKDTIPNIEPIVTPKKRKS